jgi:putative oxidoreductase
MKNEAMRRVGMWYLRLGLGTAFLAAVTDRFALWGAHGTPNVSWGDFGHFIAYTAQLNWFLPSAMIPALAWTVTVAESALGVALLLGLYLRPVAYASAALLTMFALAMTVALGVKAPLNFSVFTAAGGALLLGAISPSRSSPCAGA